MAGWLKGYWWTTQRSYEYILGNYEELATVDRFIKWCKSDAVFYDLGGNIGYHALLANRFITTGTIYSFEPVPQNLHLFKKHIALNNDRIKKNNITILPFAIANEEKQVQFSNVDQSDGNTYITLSPVYKEAAGTITVQCYSIDGLLAQGYAVPTIIKIDVEGAELDVLKGAINTLTMYKPNILLATHDCHLPGVKDACVDFLTAMGYVLQHTGYHNKYMAGLDDFIAEHPGRTV